MDISIWSSVPFWKANTIADVIAKFAPQLTAVKLRHKVAKNCVKKMTTVRFIL